MITLFYPDKTKSLPGILASKNGSVNMLIEVLSIYPDKFSLTEKLSSCSGPALRTLSPGFKTFNERDNMPPYEPRLSARNGFVLFKDRAIYPGEA